MRDRLRHILLAFLAVVFAVPVFGAALDDLRAGVAQSRQGHYEEAIRLFTRAIDAGGLSPENKAAALVNRAYALQRSGEMEDALADYDVAIRIAPSPAAYRNRGIANLEWDHYEDAAEDFLSARGLVKASSYDALWLHLARQKLGADDAPELTDNFALVDPSSWPSPILGYFAGQTSLVAVRKAAESSNTAVRAVRRCDFAFFVGEHHLAEGMKDSLALLREARDVCPRESVERALSRTDIMRLGR
jgi:tetratricopeptide (TPR) repeat protein